MQVYIGIDWSEKKHDAVFVNEAAAVLAIVTFEHTPKGLAQLESVRRDLGVDPKVVLVALETAHNLLIDYLWARNYTQVFVVPPSVVTLAPHASAGEGSHQRYRQAFTRIFGDDIQDPKGDPIMGAVVPEIITPNVFRKFRFQTNDRAIVEP